MAQGTNFTNDSAFLPVFNDGLVDIPEGRIVIGDTDGVFFVNIPADGAAQTTYVPLGITHERIPSKSWGVIAVRSGMVMNVKSGAAITQYATVTASSVAGQNGKALTAAAGAPSVGIALSAATAADQDVKVLIDRGRNAL